MRINATRCLPAAMAIMWLAGCEFTSTLELRNLTGTTLVPYPVVTTPPPPHRVEARNAAVRNGDTIALDPNGFNPLLYAPDVADPGKANAISFGFDLQSNPLQILWQVHRYPERPDNTGANPALQPILLHEGLETVADQNQLITVSVPTDIGVPPPPGGWKVEIKQK